MATPSIGIQFSHLKGLGQNVVPDVTCGSSGSGCGDGGGGGNRSCISMESKLPVVCPVECLGRHRRRLLSSSISVLSRCRVDGAGVRGVCHVASEADLRASPPTQSHGSVKTTASSFSADNAGRGQLRQWRKHSAQSQETACAGSTSAMEAAEVATSNHVATAVVLDLLKSADAVCFDVDSTVCVDEGIDELAAYCGAGEAVAAWTTRAMTGSVPFEEALAARLGIIKPSAKQLTSYLASNPPRLSAGIQEVISKLHARGVHVYLISGGFRQMINPVAAILGISEERIFANLILFDEAGNYIGFDDSEPTSRSGGKPLAIESLKKMHGYNKIVMVGDGATDLEARRPGGADLFIGYGGIHTRPAVAASADWFIVDFQDLIKVLNDMTT